MSRSSRAAKGAITSTLQYGLQTLSQVIIAPLVLRFAGQETLGAYAIVMQVVAYLSFTDLGFSFALGRYLAQAFGYDDHGRQFYKVMTTGRTFLVGTGIARGVLVFLFSLWADKAFSLSAEVSSQVRIGLQILAVWDIIRTPWLIFWNGLNATQRLAAANLSGIAGNVTRLFLTIWLVMNGAGIVGLILGNVFSDAVALILQVLHYRRLYPQLLPGWGIPDRALVKEMLGFGAQGVLIGISWRLIASTDNVVVGYLYGAAAASVYYSTQMPSTIGYLIVNQIPDNATPALNELYARGDWPALRRIFIQLHRYTLLVSSLLFMGIVVLNRRLIEAWVGPGQYAGDVMTVALAIFTLFITISKVNDVYIYVSGKIKTLTKLIMIEGVVNLTLSLILGRIFGLQGVMVATVIASLITATYRQWRARRDQALSIREYGRRVLAPALPPIGAGLVSSWLAIQLLPKSGWVSLLAVAGIMVGTYLVTALVVSVTREERSWLIGRLRRLARIGTAPAV